MHNMAHVFTFVVSILGSAAFLAPPAHAAVPLPWSTTYNCANWTQSDGLYPPAISCDGLTGYGGWTTSDGMEEQITASANYPGGTGGKGQRHWLGDPGTNNSGGTKIEWSFPQPELWIRWYLRFQQGFAWVPGYTGFKILYIDVGTPRHVIPNYQKDKLVVVINGNPYYSNAGNGWNAIMVTGATDANGNQTSDGAWHLNELHMRMDTNGTDGILEWWVDGVLRMSHSNVNYNTHSGWSYMVIGENHAGSANGPVAYYVDYDDFAIRTTGPIGPVGPGDTLAPAAPSNLTVQ